MEFEEEGQLRWRKPAAPAPIKTKRTSSSANKDEILMRMMEEDVDQEEPLSPAARLFHEPNFNVHVIAIMGGKTTIQPHVIKANLPHTLLKHPRFSSLLVVDEENGGEMKWVKTEVDLDKHIVVPNLDPNMDSPDQFVEDYIYDLSKTSIDKTKPLWELHLLNLKSSEAEAIGIFRIHHSLGDGTSLMSLLLACTRQISDPEALPTIPVKKKRDNKSSSWLEYVDVNRGFWWCFFGVWWVFKLFWNTFVDVFMFMLTALYLKDTETPIKARPGSEFNPRRFVYHTVSLDDMKLIKNAMNLTINDVALGITQAGLSRYLNRRYECYYASFPSPNTSAFHSSIGLGENNKNQEERTEKQNNLPEKILLRSTLLINIRPAAGIQALADMMEKNSEAKWGNWIGYVLLPFTIGLRDDPLDYIREAKATIDRKKHSLEAIYTFSISELVLKLFGIKRASGVSHRIITNTTMCFSNLVGPIEEIDYYGHPISFIAASTYGQPHALVINLQSYVNKMTIVLSVDENTIPDPHRLCDDIVESLKLIKEAVIARGLVK